MTIDTSKRTTETPTEPGVYLFIGETYFPRGVGRRMRTEVIHVTRESQGRLMWVGKDFYDPKSFVGVWLPLDEVVGALQPEADNLFVERAAVELVPQQFTFGDTLFDLPKKLDRDCGALAERVLAAAIASGVVEECGGTYHTYHILKKKP